MYCVRCGLELKNDYQFCPRCGTPVLVAAQNASEMKTERRREEMAIAWRQCRENKKYEKEICRKVKRMERRNKVVHCPKCKSTSISYAPKPSWGRAFIGYGLGGDVGAIIGSMTGKKKYAVCLNCGRTWKL